MPVAPFTHNHGRHPIAYNDHVKHPVDCADYHDHEQQPVTVADLLDHLDAYLGNNGTFDQRAYASAIERVDDDTRASYQRIRDALIDLARLSPEERAEFDRRTT